MDKLPSKKIHQYQNQMIDQENHSIPHEQQMQNLQQIISKRNPAIHEKTNT